MNLDEIGRWLKIKLDITAHFPASFPGPLAWLRARLQIFVELPPIFICQRDVIFSTR